MKTRALCTVVILLFLGALAWGALSVTIKEWPLPASDRFPHDPAVAADGALWFTGMGSNTLGRLDPKTGTFRSFPLKTPESGPHGLVADREGKVWFTANYKGYIGSLDPKDGSIAEYPLPDKKARDPHTPILDSKGNLWFTVQQGNFIGRLEHGTGKITLKPSPSADSRPYGIAVNSKDIPFFCEFGTNKIGTVDPATMTIREYPVTSGARPRRIAISADDIIWYTDHQRGYLGRLDPKTGTVKDWPSPGGRKSAPYGIAATPDGAIWYSESGVKPNTVVRFDPGSAKFAVWKVPSGGGVIRNMVATAEGEIYLACSGANTVGVVRVSR